MSKRPDFNTPDALNASVRAILEHPQDRKWSSLGLGMLRTYLDNEHRFRLNIWDHSLLDRKASGVHDHPWGFSSYIVSGGFFNFRFHEAPYPGSGNIFHWDHFNINDPVGPMNTGGDIELVCGQMEVYTQGMSYSQRADEIHLSRFSTGTVTLNDRSRDSEERTARIFWPRGEEWVNANPRSNVPLDVVDRITKKALTKWG